MGTYGPTVPLAAGRVSELVSDRPISSLSFWHAGAFVGARSCIEPFSAPPAYLFCLFTLLFTLGARSYRITDLQSQMTRSRACCWLCGC